MTDDERWQQWQEWFQTIFEDVQSALINRTIFQEVRAMIDANPKIQKHSSFYEWMANVYADSGLMAVRRQLDTDTRSVSLTRLLKDIAEHPHVLSRDRFVALYRWELQDLAHRDFDREVGQGAPHIDPHVVEANLEAFREATADIERYGTKRVAHLDAEGPTNVPTFGELETVLELLRTLLKKYMLLLRAVSYDDPVWVYDWKAIFREPWIPP